MRTKSPTTWNLQLAKSHFQTRSVRQPHLFYFERSFFHAICK
ncbi:MAG: DUF6783 domain-containing protein [Blautia sp.]